MIFKEKYAEYYDLFYKDTKDYERECDYIENTFLNNCDISFQSLEKDKINILDLACGTGIHSLILKKEGYNVLGIDLSEDMIKVAKKKAEEANLNINYKVMAMQNLSESEKFHLITCNFAAFDYLIMEDDVNKFIKSIYQALIPGGVFVFDFWNKNKFETSFEKFRVKDIKEKDIRVIRISESKNIKECDLLKIDIKTLIICKDKIIDEFIEQHKMRYWDTNLLKHKFIKNGFLQLKCFDFLTDNKDISNSWTISVVAKK